MLKKEEGTHEDAKQFPVNLPKAQKREERRTRSILKGLKKLRPNGLPPVLSTHVLLQNLRGKERESATTVVRICAAGPFVRTESGSHGGMEVCMQCLMQRREGDGRELPTRPPRTWCYLALSQCLVGPLSLARGRISVVSTL